MRRTLGRRAAWAAALVGAAAACAARDTSAFCQTYACSTAGCPSDPAKPDCFSGGQPLLWSVPCIGFSLQQDGSSQVDFETFESVADAAFGAWQAVRCDGDNKPTITVTRAAPASCDKLEYNPSGPNANVLMFRDKVWPYENSPNVLALTTLTFSMDTGEIFDADMEINGTSAERLTTGDQNVGIDLLSILTHEAGHFVGLAHSPDPDATMFKTYVPGSTDFRSLSADDLAGICAIYPQGRSVQGYCDPTPRHGFSPACDAPSVASQTVGCSVPVLGAPSAGAATALGALAFARAARRRRGA